MNINECTDLYIRQTLSFLSSRLNSSIDYSISSVIPFPVCHNRCLPGKRNTQNERFESFTWICIRWTLEALHAEGLPSQLLICRNELLEMVKIFKAIQTKLQTLLDVMQTQFTVSGIWIAISEFSLQQIFYSMWLICRKTDPEWSWKEDFNMIWIDECYFV